MDRYWIKQRVVWPIEDACYYVYASACDAVRAKPCVAVVEIFEPSPEGPRSRDLMVSDICRYQWHARLQIVVLQLLTRLRGHSSVWRIVDPDRAQALVNGYKEFRAWQADLAAAAEELADEASA